MLDFFIFSYKRRLQDGTSPKQRVRDDDFMVGSWSDHARNVLESSFYWRKQFTAFSLKS